MKAPVNGLLFVMFRVEEHTRALKMVGTREHFNEHPHVANTAVYNIYISYYISLLFPNPTAHQECYKIYNGPSVSTKEKIY